jgi:hypothetical protein
MNEIPVLFGPDSSLVGVVCQPAGKLAGNLACLTFNAGVVPRIGPHRFNVKLSRMLARDGILNLRFDLSGQGDSRPASQQQDFMRQAIADIRSAMDYLQQTYGISRFALVGNCSGAVQIYWVAQEDERVAGILMFDGFWYRTKWSRLARHLKRLHAIGWQGAVAALWRRVARVIRPGSPVAAEPEPSIFQTDDLSANPPRENYCRAMQAMVDRGINVFLVFSGGVIDYYSYANQFRDAFGRESFFSKVRCDFIPQIDHTLLSLESQNLFIDVIRHWIPTMLGPEASTAPQSSAGRRA